MTEWLNREEQAARMGVTVLTRDQYVQRHKPPHPNPYPVWVEGQHKRFGRSRAVADWALEEWIARQTELRQPAALRHIPAEELLAAVTEAGGLTAAARRYGVSKWLLRGELVHHFPRDVVTATVKAAREPVEAARAEASAAEEEGRRTAANAAKASRAEERAAVRARMVQMYREDKSINQIGEALGRDPSGVWRILVKEGAARPGERRPAG